MYLVDAWRILMCMHSGQWRLGHRPALDGLRGIAIGLVLLAHTFPGEFVNGGSVGVTVFFALSGFLITSLLIEERASTGRLSLRRFYIRRGRRLLPALIAYLTFWTVLAVAGWSAYQVKPGEVIAALFYFSNWVMAVGGGLWQPYGITWSLAIEEQFYLLWPLTFLLARRWPRLPLVTAAAGVVVAVVLRLVLWDNGKGAWEVYYRSDTRMDSLLIGCLVALVVHRTGARGVDPRVGWIGVGGLGVLLAWQSDAVKYLAEPFAASVAACTIIMSVLVGGSHWLEWSPLRWLGQRSYALYLWHYPILAMVWADMLPLWAGLVLSFVAAELSWWLIERPFRRTRQPVATSSVAESDDSPTQLRTGPRVGVAATVAQPAGQ